MKANKVRKLDPGGDNDRILIDDIDEDVIALLEERAKEHGRTLNEEVLAILRDAISVKKRKVVAAA